MLELEMKSGFYWPFLALKNLNPSKYVQYNFLFLLTNDL